MVLKMSAPLLKGRDLFFKRLWQVCFDQAVAAAVVQVNRPGLTSLHSETVKRTTVDRYPTSAGSLQ
jgi:hypothetical protein